MENNQDSTLICSLVFLDVVGYSKEPVAQQIVWKRVLNEYIRESIINVPSQDRIILDTGDGAALCFLKDPESALVAALQLLKAVCGPGALLAPPLQLRIGTNVGSVRIVTDINSQPNVVGDGINVGQRVMSFSDINTVMASRSFHEVVSCLTSEYRNLFRYAGIRQDKHGREHELYTLVAPESLNTATNGTMEEMPAIVTDADRPLCDVLFDPKRLLELEETLLPYVGPMAKILISRATKSVANLTDLCLLLGQLIPHEKQRSTFINKALHILQGSNDSSIQGNGVECSSSEPLLIDSRLMDIIHMDLASHIGPIAKMVLKKESLGAKSLDDLILRLKSHYATLAAWEILKKKVMA